MQLCQKLKQASRTNQMDNKCCVKNNWKNNHCFIAWDPYKINHLKINSTRLKEKIDPTYHARFDDTEQVYLTNDKHYMLPINWKKTKIIAKF